MHQTNNQINDMPTTPKIMSRDVPPTRPSHFYDKFSSNSPGSGDSKDRPPRKPTHEDGVQPTKPSASGRSWDDTDSMFDNSTIFTIEEATVYNESQLLDSLDLTASLKEHPTMKIPSTPIDDNSSKILRHRLKMVEEFIRTANSSHSYDGIRRVCTPDFRAVFYGTDSKVAYEMDLDAMIPAGKELYETMPDFRLMYSTIEESNKEKGVLVLHDFVATGHHTGKPYVNQFASPDAEPIQPSGKLVVLDEAYQLYSFDPVTNKICKLEEFALGEVNGIPGLFELLGRG